MKESIEKVLLNKEKEFEISKALGTLTGDIIIKHIIRILWMQRGCTYDETTGIYTGIGKDAKGIEVLVKFLEKEFLQENIGIIRDQLQRIENIILQYVGDLIKAEQLYQKLQTKRNEIESIEQNKSLTGGSFKSGE